MKLRFFCLVCFIWAMVSVVTMKKIIRLNPKVNKLSKGMVDLNTKMDKIIVIHAKVDSFDKGLAVLNKKTDYLATGMGRNMNSLNKRLDLLNTKWGKITGLHTKVKGLNKGMTVLNRKMDKLIIKKKQALYESCKKIKTNTKATWNGKYNLLLNKRSTTVYCDMSNGGWTLVARFSNADGRNWMAKSGHWWYDGTGCAGSNCASYYQNSDMRNTAFYKMKGNDLKITRSDDPSHKALLTTVSNCLGGKSFRTKITSYGNFRNGAVWSSNKCLGSCSITYGPGAYKTTAGFKKYSCSSNIQRSNKIGFWCDWSQGDGAVIMIGGGGSKCGRADHGLGITEENAAKFGGSSSMERDFGNEADQKVEKGYSLNIWVK